MTSPGLDVLVVGAGVSGLSCARRVADAGRRVQVVDRARGVGGRCATHRLEGMAFDHGVAFLHGSDPAFLAALREVPGPRIEGWPSAVRGTGRPCNPEAFQRGEERLALVEGVSAFPKHLARGLDVRTGAAVERIDLSGPSPTAHLAGGATVAARHLVLALAAEQSLRLLDGVSGSSRPLDSMRALLETASSEASLALCATYPAAVAPPDWHVWYPEGSDVVQLVSNESSKRGGGPLGLLLQARPGWARRHLDDGGWPAAVLAEAGRLLGAWAATPASTHDHRWRFARSDLASELAGPVLVALESGGSLGICGDRFARGGGVEAAWISGRELGRRVAALEVA